MSIMKTSESKNSWRAHLLGMCLLGMCIVLLLGMCPVGYVSSSPAGYVSSSPVIVLLLAMCHSSSAGYVS